MMPFAFFKVKIRLKALGLSLVKPPNTHTRTHTPSLGPISSQNPLSTRGTRSLASLVSFES